MRLRKTTSLALCLAAGLAGAACGSDEEGKPIPSDSATALEGQLDNINARLANGSLGACNDVLSEDPNQGNVQPVDQLIANMPDDVDEDIVSALSDGFDRLFELVQERCDELQRERDEQQQQEEEQDEPEITVPEQTDTETTPTETVPPETEPETVPEDQPLPPGGDGETPPGQDGADPGQGGGGGVIVPEGGE